MGDSKDRMDDKEDRRTVDLSGEAIHWDLADKQSYSRYLDLERLLAAQNPATDSHDEMLFIVIHQATELWLKLCLHELSAARRHIQADDLGPCFKMLARVARIQTQLIQSWDILGTLTPPEYLAFRDALGAGSGFQSWQYRQMEFVLGNKNARLIDVHRHDAAVTATLETALAEPSLYDESLRLLARRGFAVPDAVTTRDWRRPYCPDAAVEVAWLGIYRDTEKYWDLYELAEKLVDFESRFQQWRFNHLKTVERIIGHKRGTGGTSGVGYLKKALEISFFPELWSLRTKL